MSIQTIIDNSQFITFDKRKVVGQTISRSGRIKTAEVASANPYRFKVGMHSGLKYSDNRALCQEIDTLDRSTEETIDIGSTNGSLSYVTAYLGDGYTGTITATSASGNELVLNTTSASGSGTLFRKGDFIQLGSNYRYPYQVTSDVSWNGTSVTVPLHRAFISQSGYSVSGKTLLKGTAVTWRVKMMIKPSYSIVPHDRLEFDADFELIEVIE